MAERWRQQQEQDANAASTAGGRSSKPAWLIELENAKESEYGVFENEPEVCASDMSVMRANLKRLYTFTLYVVCG